MVRYVYPVLAAVGGLMLLYASLVGDSGAEQTALSKGVVAAFSLEGQTLDPAKYSSGGDLWYISQMFEQLIHPTPDGELRNWLAESWSLARDGEPVIEVTIREGVKFHNGEALTSEDFQFAYQRLSDPNTSRWSHYQAQVERFEVVDDHRFRIHFKQPDAAYIAGNLQLYAMPKDYFERVGPEEFAAAPVGTGPWKFVSRRPGEELRLEAFDAYWNDRHRPGRVEKLTIKIIPENATRVAALRRGEVDWIDSVPPVMVAEVEQLADIETASLSSISNMFINFPTHDESTPFSDVRVRKAIAHAVDIDAIIEHVLFGQGERYVQVAEGSLGYDPDLDPYAYDPKKARELLRAAGYPNGFATPCYVLNTPRAPMTKEVGEVVVAYLGQVGIRCQVRLLEYGAWLNLGRRATSPELDGVLTNWLWGHGIPGDPTLAWMGHLHSYVEGEGWGSYSYDDDPKADRMVERLSRTMDTAERDALARKIARYKHENVLGGIPTYRPKLTLAWRSDRIAFTPWPSGTWRKFQEVRLEK